MPRYERMEVPRSGIWAPCMDGRKRIKMKTMTENVVCAYVCSMRVEFNFLHSRFRTL